MHPGHIIAGAMAAIVLLTGAAAPTSTAPTSTSPTTTTVPPAPEHRIGVRVGESGGEFYDRTTGETWIPRGFNHWRWDRHNGYLMDRTFRAGANELDEAKADLAAMASYGYNAVRIWVSACFENAPGCMVAPDGELRMEYIENVAEYLRAAKDQGIVVMFTVDDLVGPVRYEQSAAHCCDEWRGFNLFDLTQGGIDDQVRFWDDLVGGLIAVGAPMDAIWAYELRNEHFLEADQPPFGVLDEATTANGQTYDLTDPAGVQAMLDDGRAHWAMTLARHIKSLDPTALVTVGYFASGQGPIDFGDDRRLVDPRPVAALDEIDFIDFHHYPGMGPERWEDVWTNSLLTEAGHKPVVLGEIGAFYEAYDTIEEAITAYTVTIGAACRSGLDGYLGWVWANLDLYDETWDAVGSDGAIAAALAPAAFPDPCSPPPPATGNLAFEQPVTASLFEDTDEFSAPPRNAVDGSESTWWTAPDGGPQWIEVDLGRPSTVERIRMVTELGADTPMTVEVELLDAARSVVGSHRFESAEAVPRLVFEHTFEAPVGDVRFARATTFREGWIIWHELEVYGR